MYKNTIQCNAVSYRSIYHQHFPKNK